MGLVVDERIRDEKKIGNENSVSGSCELECVCVYGEIIIKGRKLWP
jgi:hypothetical protein